MSRRSFTDEQEWEVVKLYEGGQSLRMVASHFGTSVVPVQRVLTERGVQRRPTGRPRGTAFKEPRPEGSRKYLRDYTDEQVAEVLRLWTEGETQLGLAMRFECSPQTIDRLLTRGGLPTAERTRNRERHWNWRGGRRMVDGYVQVKANPTDPIAVAMAAKNGYVLEHRLVMAHALGRPLTKSETVHHKDDVRKDDNRIENLQLRQGQHGTGAAFVCGDCGSHSVVPVALS